MMCSSGLIHQKNLSNEFLRVVSFIRTLRHIGWAVCLLAIGSATTLAQVGRQTLKPVSIFNGQLFNESVKQPDDIHYSPCTGPAFGELRSYQFTCRVMYMVNDRIAVSPILPIRSA